MTGGIDEKGRLYIDRPGKRKFQLCCFKPYTLGSVQACNCSDFCPQFGELESEGGNTTLTICQNRKLVFSFFEDKRA
jgi:hypothetical protein